MNNLWKEIYFWAFLWKCVFVRFSFTWNILNKDIALSNQPHKIDFQNQTLSMLQNNFKSRRGLCYDFKNIQKTKIKFQKYLKNYTVTIRDTNILQNVWKRRP